MGEELGFLGNRDDAHLGRITGSKCGGGHSLDKDHEQREGNHVHGNDQEDGVHLQGAGHGDALKETKDQVFYFLIIMEIEAKWGAGEMGKSQIPTVGNREFNNARR